jgi:putative ABC transport system permease protein
MFESLKSDSRSAFQTLRHRPGVAAAVVLTLSLGIAANTAVFSVVDAVLLKPLPYPEPERIVTLWNRYGTNRTASSPPDYMDRRRESRLLELSAAWTSRPANLAIEGEARRVETARVTADFFRVMGVDPIAGAAALPEETSGSGERIALLSFGLWQSAFGGKDVLGRSLRLDGESYLVIGVMPRGFDFPAELRSSCLWFTPNSLRRIPRKRVPFEVARKPGSAIRAACEMEESPPRPGWCRNASPSERLEWWSPSATIWWGAESSMLAAAVFVVLLVTGANVAHILLASGSSRFHELALRSSLGATRGRLVSQLVAESVLLGMAGGALGLALSFLVIGATPKFLAAELPGARDIALDGRAVAFTFLVALGMGVLSGLAPARIASGTALRASVRSSASNSTGGARRLRSALVVSQVALALVLMIAGLLVRSYERFRPGRVSDLGARLRPRLPALLPGARGAGGARELLERLRAIPGFDPPARPARRPRLAPVLRAELAPPSRPARTQRRFPIPEISRHSSCGGAIFRAPTIPAGPGRRGRSLDGERFWPEGRGPIDVGRDLRGRGVRPFSTSSTSLGDSSLLRRSSDTGGATDFTSNPSPTRL